MSVETARERGASRAPCVRLLLASTLLLLGACGLNDDPPKTPKLEQDSGISLTDGGGKMPPPLVTSLPATACSNTVPIHGTTLPRASIFVQGGASSAGISTDANPLSGQFCLDVPLQPQRLNQLEVRAFSGELGSSEAVVVSVTHTRCDPAEPQDPSSEEPINAALGLLAKASLAPLNSEMAALTDGDPETVTVFQDDWGSAVANADEWVLITFDKLIAPDSVVIRWRDTALTGDAFAVSYKVLISDQADSGDPKLNDPLWHVVADITAGDGGVDTIALPKPNPLIRHLALWLVEDYGIGRETFAIAEIEVMVPGASTGPKPEPNTCIALGL